MLSTYGLTEEHSILQALNDFREEEVREYCWQELLHLKKALDLVCKM